MDRQRNDLLAEMARNAAMERSEFLARSGEQLDRFLRDHADRIHDLGGLTLIDDDPDYLAIAPDGSFRSRSRIYNEATGEWSSETEVIETAGELVELYNPADVFGAFAQAARDGVWTQGDGDPGNEADPDGGSRVGMPFVEDPYVGAADSWAAGRSEAPVADDHTSAATALYELALDFQERSQQVEAGLLEQFESSASSLLGPVGVVVVVDDDDEHLELAPHGFRGRVVAEGQAGWTDLDRPDEIVRFYDPTDIFGDLADAIADAFPGVADSVPGDDGEA